MPNKATTLNNNSPSKDTTKIWYEPLCWIEPDNTHTVVHLKAKLQQSTTPCYTNTLVHLKDIRPRYKQTVNNQMIN